jgi:hypothetical protein
METFGKILSFVLLFCALTNVGKAQDASKDSTGNDGDHFSLEGVLAMLKKANSPEEFEKLINEPENNITNMDLNDDKDVDYIRVTEKKDGDARIFILQAVIGDDDYTDVAIVALEKTGAETAELQVTGDEDIFGEEITLEPQEETAEDKGKRGPNDFFEVRLRVVNVWTWALVRTVFAPGYAIWVSPYSWRKYPRWWTARRPLAWNVYYGKRMIYNPFRYRAPVLRVHKARGFYKPHRRSSVVVKNRRTVIINKRGGHRLGGRRRRR